MPASSEELKPYSRLAWGALLSVFGLSFYSTSASASGSLRAGFDTKGVGFALLALGFAALAARPQRTAREEAQASRSVTLVLRLASVFAGLKAALLLVPVPEVAPLRAVVAPTGFLVALGFLLLAQRRLGDDRWTHLAAVLALVSCGPGHWTLRWPAVLLVAAAYRSPAVWGFCLADAVWWTTVGLVGYEADLRFDLFAPLQSTRALLDAQGAVLFKGWPLVYGLLLLLGTIALAFRLRRAEREATPFDAPAQEPPFSLARVAQAGLALLAATLLAQAATWVAALPAGLEPSPQVTRQRDLGGQTLAAREVGGRLALLSRGQEWGTASLRVEGAATGEVLWRADGLLGLPQASSGVHVYELTCDAEGRRWALGASRTWEAPVYVLAEGQEPLRVEEDEFDTLGRTALSADGARLAYAFRDHDQDTLTVEVRDLAAERRLLSLSGLRYAVMDLAFLPGDRLAGIDPSGKLLVWDLSSGAVVLEDQQPLRAVRLCPAGETLVVVHHDEPITSWTSWSTRVPSPTRVVLHDLGGGERREVDLPPGDTVVHAAYDPARDLLVTAGEDRLQVHDLASGRSSPRPPRPLEGADGSGRALAGLGFDDQGRVWVVDAAGRTLTFAWRSLPGRVWDGLGW